MTKERTKIRRKRTAHRTIRRKRATTNPSTRVFQVHAGSGQAGKPAVAWIASPNFASRQGTKINTLVLHNTDTTLSKAITRFKDPASQVSAHYLVDRDGSITQMVSDSDTAWHSRKKEVNQESIGIEVVAWNTAAGTTPPQEASLVQLCKYLLDAYAVDLARVLPHRAIKPTDCPGWVWPTDQDFVTWKNTKLV